MLKEIAGRFPPLYRSLNRLRGLRLHEPEIRVPHRLLGSAYGAWPLPDGAVSETSVVYSFGIGRDISFDLALIESTHCTVHAFDPTPSALEWLTVQALPAQFRYQQVGIGAKDGFESFAAPSKAGHVSFRRGEGHSFKVSKLSTIMQQLGHSHIDFLKMDVEGFEYDVLDNILQTDVRPRVLAVEFHHMMHQIPQEKTKSAVAALKCSGYRCFWVSDIGHEYGFLYG